MTADVTLVYASPGAPTVEQVRAWRGIEVVWHGWDGSRWVLTDPRSGVFLHAAEVRGLHMPPMKMHVAESDAVPGVTHRGSRALARELFLPIAVNHSGGSEDWLTLDASFWHTMDPDLAGEVEVIQPSGRSRRIAARYADEDGDHTFPEDPAQAGWGVYGVVLRADEPHYRGDPVVALWRSGGAIDMFGDGTVATFWVSEGEQFATATIRNPGDVPAWLTYWIGGPMSSADVGVGGRLIDVDFSLAAGRLLVLDSSPGARTAIEVAAPPLVDGVTGSDEYQEAWVAGQIAAGNGIDRTSLLGDATKWEPVPRQTTSGPVSLNLAMTGTGYIRARLVPLYRRPW